MLSALVGGVLIGAAATLFWFANGRIAGVSGIVHGAVWGRAADRGVRLAFLLGLVLAGSVFSAGGRALSSVAAPLGTVLAGGLFAGFGARLGGGCTSGHGVCGLSRFSLRSLVATVTFIATGAVTVFVVRHLMHLGGSV